MDKSRVTRKIITIFVAAFNILILFAPEQMIAASASGLNTWLYQVFPSLFPFMAGINILTAMGALERLGQFMAPLTRKLFRMPGAAGLALVTGMASGYPMGARMTAALLTRGELSAEDAQRLLAFVNNSGPLFVIGAVGAGMLGSSKAGYFILAAHYAASILTGALFSIGKRNGKPYQTPRPRAAKTGETAPFGEILADGAADAMASMLKIGGFIIIFSVVARAVCMLNMNDFAKGLVCGIFEITNGIKTLVSSADVSARVKVTATAALVSFGGLSILAQTAAFLKGTKLKMGTYLAGKITQTALTAALTLGFYPVFAPFFEGEVNSRAADSATVMAAAGGSRFAYAAIISLSSVAIFASICYNRGRKS